MSLDAKQMPVSELLSRDRQYRIPNFQRPYAWGFDEAYQLVEDLISAWRRGDESYFLGSIVVVFDDAGGRTVDVIDGQQRLTTLSLMLAVLRHYFITDDAQRAEISELLQISGNTILGVTERSRLCLRDADQEFYRQYIVDDDLLGLAETSVEDRDSKAKNNIKENVDAIREGLTGALDDVEALEFLQFFLARVYLVMVSTDNFSNAHRIFGVLNTRGIPLTAGDIFKARVVGAVSEGQRNHYGEIWDRSIESLKLKEPDSFFHHLLVTLTKNPSKRALLEEFDMVLDRHLAEGGEAFVDGILVPYTAAYLKLTSGSQLLPRDLQRQVDLLNQHQSEDWKPVAMWILVNVTDSATALDLITKLERLFGVLVIAHQGSETRSARLAGVLRALAEYTEKGGMVAVNHSLAVGDELRQNALYRMKAALPRGGVVRRVLLTRAHVAASGGATGLPRSYGVATLIPREGIDGVAASIDAEYWKQRLGGLILTRANASEVSRKGSADALGEMFEAKGVAPETLASVCPDLSEATQESLEERHEELVRLIATYWGITHDNEGVDLTRLSESELLQTTGGYRIRRSRRVALADVVHVGMISPGDVFVWRRPNKGEVYRVTVTDSGTLRLPTGGEADSPSGAVAAVSGSSASALDVWVRESDGKKLREMWTTYEKRFTARG